MGLLTYNIHWHTHTHGPPWCSSLLTITRVWDTWNQTCIGSNPGCGSQSTVHPAIQPPPSGWLLKWAPSIGKVCVYVCVCIHT